MNLAIKISLLCSGIFLLTGMLMGVVKYQRTMTSIHSRAPVYVDIAHRASFLYSFASLVIAKLLEYSPYSLNVQLAASSIVLLFFALTIVGYIWHGLRDTTDNLFSERNFTTTWFMYLLIAAEISGLAVILWGFVSTQILN
jgi:hypothetical protein